MFKQKSKKGVSPLIATVLLIGFAVAIAGALFAWIQTGIIDKAKAQTAGFDTQLNCAGVSEDQISFSNIACAKGTNELTLNSVAIQNTKSGPITSYMIGIECTGKVSGTPKSSEALSGIKTEIIKGYNNQAISLPTPLKCALTATSDQAVTVFARVGIKGMGENVCDTPVIKAQTVMCT